MAIQLPEVYESSESQAALERERERLHRALRGWHDQPPVGEDAARAGESAADEAATREGVDVARRQAASWSKFQGDLGEQEAAAIAVQRLELIGAPDFTPGWHGLDGVYYDRAGRIVVLEAKFTEAELEQALHPTKHGQQMSPEWIDYKVERMRTEGSALYTPGNARVGVEIADAAPEDLRRITVLIHPGTLEARAYEATPAGDWHLIDTWSVLDIEPSA